MGGKLAYVTGGMGGIGTSICQRLAKDGFTVVAGCGPSRNFQQWLDDQAAQGYTFHASVGNVSDWDSTMQAFNQIRENLGPVDVLVNNAGITRDGLFRKMSHEDWRAVIDTNLNSLFNVTKQVIEDMVDRQWGRIINIVSITLSGGWERLQPYVESKGAMLGNTRALARELGVSGITCNAISPGAFPTAAEAIHPDLPGYERMVLERQSIKRRGHANDIAAALLFLASDEASFITGQTLAVDGGWVMH